MVEDSVGVHHVRLFRAPFWCPSGGGNTREAEGALSCRGKSINGRAQQRSTVSGDYALLDSARAESSSIVDKPGEC